MSCLCSTRGPPRTLRVRRSPARAMPRAPSLASSRRRKWRGPLCSTLLAPLLQMQRNVATRIQRPSRSSLLDATTTEQVVLLV